MRASIEELLDNYQVRKTRKQKQKFLEWMQKHAEVHGYQLDEQLYKKDRGRNLIVGNPETADIILTAHYDTAPNAFFPIATSIGNIPMYFLSQAFVYIPLIIVFSLLHLVLITIFGDLGRLSEMTIFFGFEVPVLTLVLLVLWSIQMMAGFPNRKSANDNTSGIAVLLSLLEDLSGDHLARICFVFFDEEEKGLVGAKAFRDHYGLKVSLKPLINFDCVAHGKHFMFIAKKGFRESKFNDVLAEVIAGKALIKEAIKYVYASDQLIFKNSVGVAAAHKVPLLGYYLNRLHSRFDSRFNANNIEILKQMMIEFIEKSSEVG